MTSVDVTTVRLPHTGLHVPNRDLTVTTHREWPTSDGVAYRSTLRRLRSIVGEAVNDGRGGETMFEPRDWKAFGPTQIDAYAAQCHTQEGHPVAGYDLLDELVTEFDWTRKISRADKKGRMMLRLMDAGLTDIPPMAIAEYSCFKATSEKFWHMLAKKLIEREGIRPEKTSWWQGWDGTRWRDITTRPTDVSAHLYW